MAKASSKSKSSKSKAKRKASPLARKAAVIRSASCKLPMSDAWKKARKAVRRPKGRAVAKKAMSLYSEACTLPMRDAWAAARAASKGTTPKPPRRARANKGYDTDFSRELSMFDYHHPAYEQTVGPFSASEAFTHGLQPANRRNPRRSARRNGKGYDTDFSREISMFDYHAPQFEQTVGPFGVSEAFTHGLQPANRRNPRKALANAGKYEYLYVLQGNYGYGWDDLSAEDKAVPGAYKRIQQTLKEYRQNERGHYRVIERREAKAKANPRRRKASR